MSSAYEYENALAKLSGNKLSAFHEMVARAAERLAAAFIKEEPLPAWLEVPEYEEFRADPQEAVRRTYAALYGAYKAWAGQKPWTALRRAKDAEDLARAVAHFGDCIHTEPTEDAGVACSAAACAAEAFCEASWVRVVGEDVKSRANKALGAAISAHAVLAMANASLSDSASEFRKAIAEERAAQAADYIEITIGEKNEALVQK